jgi:hypothetical protein
MHITSEPQEWTPIDPNLENELLNAYARIAELESLVGFLRGLNKNTKWLYDNARDRIAELYGENIALRQRMVGRPGGLPKND